MNSLFKNNCYKIIELFIIHPDTNFSVREIARQLKLNHATVLGYIGKILKLGLINKNEKTLYPTYYANTENWEYKIYKKNYIFYQIKESGLIDYLAKQTFSNLIILFGSCAKGDFREESDIDIFVESKEAKIGLFQYEKSLNRTINVLFESDINNLSKELRNNILNGIVLHGFIRIKGGK